MSTLVGHFVPSPREREKRDRREGQRRKRNMNESEETEDFVCVEVLRPSQPNGVMSSAVNLPNHTFTGQA